MFTTVEQVKTLTGYDVDVNLIGRAQGILEAYLGKTEIEFESPYDMAVMGNATAYQSAYMSKDADGVFEQADIKQIAQADGGVTMNYERHAPFIAPLAFMAMSKLSFRRSRSVKVGPVFERGYYHNDWVTN